MEAIELCKRCTALWGMEWPENKFLIHKGVCSECGTYETIARPNVSSFDFDEKTEPTAPRKPS